MHKKNSLLTVLVLTSALLVCLASLPALGASIDAAVESGKLLGPVEAPNATARVAIAHLAPFAPGMGTAVTVTLDASPVLTNVKFADSTPYLTVPDGSHSVAIYPTGSATPAISKSISLTAGLDYSAIAIGDGTKQPLDLILLTDNNTAPAPGNFKLRLGHLAPFANTITATLADVRLQDGTPVITNVQFSAVAPYLTLAAGTYDLKITTPGGAVTLIDPLPASFASGDIVSAFAVGDGVKQKLGVFAWPSNAVGSLLPLGAQLQVAHLAPFANTSAGTAVTVTLGATNVLTNFKFAESTGYVPVPEGMQMIRIFAGGSATPAISKTVNFTQALAYSAVAIGDGANQPLDLIALVNDTVPVSGSAKVRIGHLAPFASTITATLADVRLQNGTVLLNDVPFGAVTNYLTLPAGSYDLKITDPTGNITLIDPLPVNLTSNSILSVFAVGDGVKQKLGAFAWPNGVAGSLLPLGAQLQIAHLAPFSNTLPGTAVTVTLNSTPVLTNVKFADSTGYLPVPEGSNQVQIFPAGSALPAISATVSFTQGLSYTAIAIGDGANQPLGLLPLLDDTVPVSGNAKVRIGHLAPFSNTITGTLADVRLQNGAPIITNVPFSLVSPYLTLPAGTYDLKITTPGGAVTLIDPLAVNLASNSILSVFAVGDGPKQPLGVFALPGGQPGSLLPLAKFWLNLPIIRRN